MKSWISIFISFIFLCSASLYYPKWEKTGTEATISWDVSGYYWYLPATFIYKDLKKLQFSDSILKKYSPTPNLIQANASENGNLVMGYSCGQALQFLPAFGLAHWLAPRLGYAADGFTRPYQVAMSLNALLIAFIGLYFLRKVLLCYFNDTTSAISIFLITVGTNYLEYASITGAMTHNWLFTIYSILIYLTILFYRSPTSAKALLIGAAVGWAALTRPTEIISCLIPLGWGVYNIATLKERFYFIQKYFSKYMIAIIIALLFGCIQFIYWKYVTGHYFFYSYQGQTFSWLHPHIKDGLVSFRAGWLVYSPMMFFAVFGLYSLWRNKRDLFPTIFVFVLLFMYICFAWDIWWYGGSLGQRAMIQSYPLWAFPLAAFVEAILGRRVQYLIFGSAIFFIYFNFWLMYQAHGGGLIDAGNMTRAYFWKVFLKTRDQVPTDAIKLLDTDEEFLGERKNIVSIYQNNFDKDTSNCPFCPPQARGKICMNEICQFTPKFEIPISNDDSFKWIRASATFECGQKEWDFWRMPQFAVHFMNDDKLVKERAIRTHRLLNDNEIKTLYIDIKKPKKPFNKIIVIGWAAGCDKIFMFDNLSVEKYSE